MKDLALLVADKNMDFAMRGILGHPERLGIRAVTPPKIIVHDRHDGGVRTTGPETLAAFRSEFGHGIVMLDLEGSGAGAMDAIDLENELDERLAKTWGDRAKSIVIVPELDVWAWGSDHAMAGVLGWSKDQKMRVWLGERGHAFYENQKPARPKDALTDLMFELREPRSSKLYQRLMERISLAKCVDPAFNRLKSALQTWFPTEARAPRA